MTSENVYTEIVAERGAKVIPDLLRGNAGNVGEIGALLDIAADEIERLRAELAEANGRINLCVDQNKYLERLLAEAQWRGNESLRTAAENKGMREEIDHLRAELAELRRFRKAIMDYDSNLYDALANSDAARKGEGE